MYEEFFGLEDEPFRLTPDPRYLFLSSKHAEALAHLRLGLTESSGFVCITGEVGSGKTTLLRTFLAEVGPNVAAACIYVPPLSGADLVRRICHEFHLPTSGESLSDLVDALHRHLVEQHAAGKTSVLVLDEAQALSLDLLEQIRLLLNLETETQKLLRIVLVGQPQLRSLLLDRDLAQLNQRITLRWHLSPLSRRETFDYVAHRLAVASGGRVKGLFTRPALRLLYGVSDGVPRIINMVAHRALLAAFVARYPRVRRRFVARAYQEIQSVPLPGTLSPLHKIAWAAAGLGLGVVLFAYGAEPLERVFDAAGALLVGSRSAGNGDTTAVEIPIAVAPKAEAMPTAAAPIAASPEALPGPQVHRISEAELVRSLRELDPRSSARAAMQAILEAWKERPLAAGELASAATLDAVAWRRGLQEVSLTGNRSMLRLLDLPALVALSAPAASDAPLAALIGMDSSHVVLAIDGTSVSVDADVFDRHWSGEARVFWRDFDRLGALLRRGSRGVPVVRLQNLLRGAGVLRSEATGRFDAKTQLAVQRFQRAHLLEPDGLVGPLTQIVLYGTSGRERPSLVFDLEARS